MKLFLLEQNNNNKINKKQNDFKKTRKRQRS